MSPTLSTEEALKIGIVGSEAAKFTIDGRSKVDHALWDIINVPEVTHVVSGHCHLGGIDIWAEEVGEELGKELLIYPPRELNWSNGYRPRNLQIAHNSDIVYCITVDKLPPAYTGMTFNGCYHCAKSEQGCKEPHIKSGGCWTALQAIKMGKVGKWIVIKQ